jgi:hypothetical protein
MIVFYSDLSAFKGKEDIKLGNIYSIGIFYPLLPIIILAIALKILSLTFSSSASLKAF